MLARTAWLAVCALAVSALAADKRLLRYDEVRHAMAERNTLDGPAIPDETEWIAWARSHDAQVRARVRRGSEDTVSNLIAYGTSFTSAPRLERASDALDATGRLRPEARRRASDLAKAMQRPNAPERVRYASRVADGVPAGRMQEWLEKNLVRYAAEQRSYEERAAAASSLADPGERLFAQSTLYRDRGLSVDTSLLPNMAVISTLEAMLRKGASAPGSIRRVAIIGPGLDFADKREGYDFYPLQSIQPFAILDGTARLGLASGAGASVTVFDLNDAVLSYFRAPGHAYKLQLPRPEDAPWTPDATAYWERFGEAIGRTSESDAPPKSAGPVKVRAVSVNPQVGRRIRPVDLDVVVETAVEGDFDLVVATNVFVYYNRFEQALALSSVASMLAPGGIFISNTALPAVRPISLDYLGRRSVAYASDGSYGDDIFVYRRRNAPGPGKDSGARR